MIYTIHRLPEKHPTHSVEVIPDQFSWMALLLPPLWMVWNRLWLVLGLYVNLILIIALASHLLNWPSVISTALNMGISILIALEASSLRRWTLNRKGWKETGVVVAPTQEIAEQRYFSALLIPSKAPQGVAL